MATLGYKPGSLTGGLAQVGDQMLAAGLFAATENGTITALGVWIDATATAGTQFTLSLYADSSGVPGSLVAQGVGDTVGATGYQEQSVSGTPTISNGVSYWLVFHGASSNAIWRYDGTTWTGKYHTQTYIHGTDPDPFPSSPTTLSDFKVGIYAVYTPSGGGGSFACPSLADGWSRIVRRA